MAFITVERCNLGAADIPGSEQADIATTSSVSPPMPDRSNLTRILAAREATRRRIAYVI
jgi:hypothetical protein